MKLYDELADCWVLTWPPEDYAAGAGPVARLLELGDAAGRLRLLELGAGGGQLAPHLKTRFEMTLAALSPRMLEQSRRLNPACRHLLGEMRSLRLGENSGAVLVFDAIGHMTTEADLLATPRTARAHPRARYGGLPPGLDGRLLRSRSLPGLNGRRGSSLGGTGS